jgi:hypothetical protein
MFESNRNLMFSFVGASGQTMCIYDDNSYTGSGISTSQWNLEGRDLFYRHNIHHDWKIIDPKTHDKEDNHFYKQFMEKYVTYSIEKELL